MLNSRMEEVELGGGLAEKNQKKMKKKTLTGHKGAVKCFHNQNLKKYHFKYFIFEFNLD